MTSTSITPFTPPKGKITVFCAGGAGVNVAQAIVAATKRYDMAGVGEIKMVMIDTSASNLPKDVKASDVYLLKDMDGSGKVRSENHARISKAALDILEKHQPGDLSIVIGSLAGGSGSVVAPTLMKALLDQGKVAIAVGIVSQDSVIEINNSIKTLKSYESIADLTGRPVVLYPQVNSDSTDHEKINTAVASAVLMLATLASRQNQGLDTADLFNWVNYQRVSNAPVKMVTLDLVTGTTVTLPEHAQPLTTATLAHKGASTKTPWISDYQCVGYVPTAAESNVSLEKPLHFVISDGVVAELYKELDTQLQTIERSRKARTYSASVLSASDNTTADGLVL